MYEENELIKSGANIMWAIVEFAKEEGLTPEGYTNLFEAWYSYSEDNNENCEGYKPILKKFIDELDIHRISKDGDYIVVTFAFKSMMVDPSLVEDFLFDKWRQARFGLKQFPIDLDLRFLRDKGLGIRLEAFAPIGGEGYCQTSATLFTPEDIRKIFSEIGI